MLNLCVFIFIFYAVSYSAKAILFGNRRKTYSAKRVGTQKIEPIRAEAKRRENRISERDATKENCRVPFTM